MTFVRSGIAEIDRFAEVVAAAVRENPDHDTESFRNVVSTVKPEFQALLANLDWLPEEYLVTTRGQSDDTTHMLAKAPDDSWTMVSVVFPPGYSTPVHDHMIWGLIGVVQGKEHESRYRRHDDGAVPGRADVTFEGEEQNLPGAVSHIIPPAEEIHLIHNPLEGNSVSIHVYGGDLDATWRHKFDPDAGTVEDYISTYTITC